MIQIYCIYAVSVLMFACGVFFLLTNRGILRMLFSIQLIVLAGLINIFTAAGLNEANSLNAVAFGLAVLFAAAAELMLGAMFVYALHKKGALFLEDKL